MREVLIGNRAVQQRLGLNRAQTGLLIETGEIRRWFDGTGRSCAFADEVDAAGRQRCADQAALLAWESEGGAAIVTDRHSVTSRDVA